MTGNWPRPLILWRFWSEFCRSGGHSAVLLCKCSASFYGLFRPSYLRKPGKCDFLPHNPCKQIFSLTLSVQRYPFCRIQNRVLQFYADAVALANGFYSTTRSYWAISLPLQSSRIFRIDVLPIFCFFPAAYGFYSTTRLCRAVFCFGLLNRK